MMLDKERFVHWYYKYKGKILSTQVTKNTRTKLSSRKSRSILNTDTSQKYPTKPFNQKWKRKLTSPKNPIPTSISNESHSQNEYKWLKFEDKGDSPEANFPFLVTVHIITDRVEWLTKLEVKLDLTNAPISPILPQIIISCWLSKETQNHIIIIIIIKKSKDRKLTK